MAKNPAAKAGEADKAAEDKVDGRYKKVKDPETGQLVNRVEYIRKLCAQPPEGKGLTRSQARDRIQEITGEKIRYQIIFAATKNMKVTPSDRGKKKEEGGDTKAGASA